MYAALNGHTEIAKVSDLANQVPLYRSGPTSDTLLSSQLSNLTKVTKSKDLGGKTHFNNVEMA